MKLLDVQIRYNNGRRKISTLFLYKDYLVSEGFADKSTTAFIKRIKQDIIPSFFEKMNIPQDTIIKWSQYAGCGCGCSPGFLVHDGRARDYLADITLDEKDPEFSSLV